ncbi:MAG: hypothetical protein U5Q44_12035 [Dehalococcoidia bacterium]|nr:hypothetical protein [Dehalococcoidia bacterium]
MVFEFSGDQLPESTVGYVERAAECGSGKAVNLDGSAVLNVRMSGAEAHNAAGDVTVNQTEFAGPGTAITEGVQTPRLRGPRQNGPWGTDGTNEFQVTTLEAAHPARRST